MSPDGTVVVDGVWKRFRADDEGNFARTELRRVAGRLRGDVTTGWRWVLRDISFRLEPGETIGLVGVNGSGKSTLLKMIAGVMFPTAGHVSTSGPISALIDVRSGIHPELTGRENILLYSRMLGLSTAEARRRFDEIVEFAGTGAALDRQVKYYSSGMSMRLGFAIASHTHCAVLIVDEALAVGDALFRQRCLERMRAVVDQGATLLFVSHGLEAVRGTCRRVVWLDDGVVRTDGPTEQVLADYRQNLAQTLIVSGSRLSVVSSTIASSDGGKATTGGDIDIVIDVLSPERLDIARVTVGVSEGEGEPILLSNAAVTLDAGSTTLTCSFRRIPLAAGAYRAWFEVADADGHSVLSWRPLGRFVVAGPAANVAPIGVARLAPIWVDSDIVTGR